MEKGNISKFLMKAQEEERKKIARELHDEIGQALTAIKINLELLRRKIDPKLVNYIDDSINLIDKTIEQVRNLSLNLRPSLLDDLGLLSSLKWYIEREKKRNNLNIEYVFNFQQEKINKDLSINIFRIIQEGLTNIIKHAQARNIFLEIKEEGENILITIKDDGIGFDVENIWEKIKEGRALGILGIKERVELFNGNMEIKSKKGEGTEIKITLSLEI
ncbi:MAG: sensor histidine kinase [Dictyoglomus sp.]|nr:sensor histidine kinase [Dictyoglomus sp.]MDW8189189.1 sensor histidine kinase [Dictyoglomus sp.]